MFVARQACRLHSLQTVLGIILGGGAGSRLYPLTKTRAKPAVPLGANYRLIDIPVSNCINSGVNKIYCMTQFNSASLNRHLASAYVSRWQCSSNVDRYVDRCATHDRLGKRRPTVFISELSFSRLSCYPTILVVVCSLQNANVGSYSNEGFVEVLAATQSPKSTSWFQVSSSVLRLYFCILGCLVPHGLCAQTTSC